MKTLILVIVFNLSLFAQGFVELGVIMGDDAGRTTGEILTDSLKAYWNMSDANDSYGDNDLTNSGVSFVTGKVGNCGDFERGENDYMYILENPTINVSGGIDFTVACWFRLESVEQYMGLMTKSGASNTREFMILALNQDLTPDAPMFIVSTDGSTPVTASDDAEAVINTWYFMVVWRDTNTDSIYIQIDNGDIIQTAFSTDIFTGGSPFVLGSLFADAPGNGMDGLIDEVGYWKRVLTPAERTYLYNLGSGRTYSAGSIQ